VSYHDDATVFATSVRDLTCGSVVKNISTGAQLSAQIEGNLDPFTLPESLGMDPRAKFRLHINCVQAASISMNDVVQFIFMGQTINSKIVHRDLYSGPQTKFIAAEINSKDQS
jgi:hypothetical protein